MAAPNPRRADLRCILDAASSAVAVALQNSGKLFDIPPIIAAIQKEHPDFTESEIKVHVVWEVLIHGGKLKEAKPTAAS